MTPASNSKQWFTYATVTSTVALIVSLSSFYFTWFYEKRSLTSGIISAGPDDVALPFTFESDVVVRNTGNRTETLLRAGIWCTSSNEQGEGLWSPKQVKDRQVLRAGDVVPLRLELTMQEVSLEECAEWTGPESDRIAVAKFEVRFSAVSPDSKEVKSVAPVGTVRYHEASGEVKFERDTTRSDWQELLR